MDFKREERGGVLVIAAKGDVNAVSSGALEAELAGAIDAGHRYLVLDLDDVRYVSSAGLRIFLVAARKLAKEGAFVIARPKETVLRVLEMTGFGKIVKIMATLEEALDVARSARAAAATPRS